MLLLLCLPLHRSERGSNEVASKAQAEQQSFQQMLEHLDAVKAQVCLRVLCCTRSACVCSVLCVVRMRVYAVCALGMPVFC